MNTISLLAGNLYKDFALNKENQTTFIDQTIEALLKLNFNIFVVVDQESSTEIIQNSKLLDECELIYDTNFQSNTMTNFQSALYATCHMSFIYPLLGQKPDPLIFSKLLSSYLKFGTKTKYHFFQAHQIIKGQIDSQYPILVTPNGNHYLRQNKRVKSLNELKDFTYNCLLKPSPINLTNSPVEPTRLFKGT